MDVNDQEQATESWSVYMLLCADDTLYTGISKDIHRRLQQHNAATASKYTRVRLPVTLVYSENAQTHGDALRRELAIKKLSRSEKDKLIR